MDVYWIKYSSSRAAIRNLSSHSSGGQKSKIRCQQGHFPTEDSGDSPFLASSSF
jgi:hypothetical protein